MTSKPVDLSAARALWEAFDAECGGLLASKCNYHRPYVGCPLDCTDVEDRIGSEFEALRPIVPQLIAEVERLRSTITSVAAALDCYYEADVVEAAQTAMERASSTEQRAAEACRRMREQKAELRTQLAAALAAKDEACRIAERMLDEADELADIAVTSLNRLDRNAERKAERIAALRGVDCRNRIHQLAAIGHASEEGK